MVNGVISLLTVARTISGKPVTLHRIFWFFLTSPERAFTGKAENEQVGADPELKC